MNNQDLHILVLGNVSAGKSTLLNALIGKTLLPSANQATTAKIFRLQSNENNKHRATILTHGETSNMPPPSAVDIANMNKTSPEQMISLICQLQSVQHHGKTIFIYDTPGPNTAIYSNHRTMVCDFIEQQHITHILCLLDATNPATDDEKTLIDDIVSPAIDRTSANCVFLLNKTDELDEKRDGSIKNTISSTSDWLQACGIPSPIILPIMAKLALLLRMQIHGHSLTRNETRELKYAGELLTARKGLLLEAAQIADEHKELVRRKPIHLAQPVLNRLYSFSPMQPVIGGLFHLFASQMQQLVLETGIRTLELLIEQSITKSPEYRPAN